MSLKIGGSKQNSSQNTTGATHSTSTPIVPEWASSLTQNAAGRVGGLLGNDPQSYVAPANGLQNLAAANATNLSGTPWNYDAAEELTGAAANSDTPNIAGNIDRFINPYLRDVVGATSADLDANDGRVRAMACAT